MRKKGLIGILLTVTLVLLSFTACQSDKSSQSDNSSTTDNTSQTEMTGTTEKSDIYRFEDYENSEVFNSENVSLSQKLADKCTSYRFTYISDGLWIKGYISIPTALEKTQKPGKCVMFNHGGNRGFGILEDSTTASVCAVCDRIVVASQYRGCGGSEGNDHFGGDDLNDVIKLIDLCEKHFSFIDMDDFCVIGASRGGVMTYPAARQDKRIKRIIALSAVCDLFSSYESRDDMKTVLEETIGATPQEKPDEYKKRSAVYWADEIKVPVLIFHSKQDKQVPYKQSEELYNKLKNHTESKLITHDDDKHAEIQIDDVPVIREWLNTK